MSCNIGYKSLAKAVIPEPEPQKFKAKTEGPKIDAELLQKLGNEDPEFLEWVQGLNSVPLLEEALNRALQKVSANGIDFKVTADGRLEASGEYKSSKEKGVLDSAFSNVVERWQFEVIGIVTELMDFEARITQSGNEIILESEEKGKTHPCDYIKVTKKGDKATVVFEHFKSRDLLKLATAKFLTLAHRLGVKITLEDQTITEGDRFPGEQYHDHKHGHHHDHED